MHSQYATKNSEPSSNYKNIKKIVFNKTRKQNVVDGVYRQVKKLTKSTEKTEKNITKQYYILTRQWHQHLVCMICISEPCIYII